MTLFFLIAGLFLILKELIPLLQALGTGVIQTRGHRRVKVERAVEPERFRGLCRQRFLGMGLGLAAIAFGVLLNVGPVLLGLATGAATSAG